MKRGNLKVPLRERARYLRQHNVEEERRGQLIPVHLMGASCVQSVCLSSARGRCVCPGRKEE